MVYNVSDKTLISAASFRIRLYKVDEFIRVYDRARYLASFRCEKCDTIYNRIRYLICHESGITYVFSHN